MDRERRKEKEKWRKETLELGWSITPRIPSQLPVWAGEGWRNGKHSWKKKEVLYNPGRVANQALSNTSTNLLRIFFSKKRHLYFLKLKVSQSRLLAFTLSGKISFRRNFVYFSYVRSVETKQVKFQNCDITREKRLLCPVCFVFASSPPPLPCRNL